MQYKRLHIRIRPGMLIALLAVAGIAVLVNLVQSLSPRGDEHAGGLFLRDTLPPETPWQQTAPGIAVRTRYWGLFSDIVAVRAVRADANCDFRVVDCHQGVRGAGGTAAHVCPAAGAAINASYFDENLTPLGLLVVDGERKQNFFTRLTWGCFLVRDGAPALLPSAGVLPPGVAQAIECKPRLLVAGRIPSFADQPPDIRRPNRRAAIAFDAQGHVIFAVTRGFLTLERWAACLRESLDCVDALNLDGGPSAQLEVRGQYPLSVPGGWQVPVFITVGPPKVTP